MGKDTRPGFPAPLFTDPERGVKEPRGEKCGKRFLLSHLMNIFADMAVIRLTKEFSFEAAHALDGYDGPCREIHGHSYRLFVTVKGCPADDDTNPKCGMVMDFGVLKSIVNEEVVSRFDHALVLRATRRDAPPAGGAGRTLRQHRHGGLPADVRKHARRFRGTHRTPPAPGGGTAFAPPA